MKKHVSFLLALAMILAMLPMLGSISSAEEPTRTPLNVSFVRASANVHSDGKTVNWSTIFDPNSTTRHYARTTTDIEIIGQFEQPTQITSVVLRNNYYRNRMVGTVVQFSTDGTNWSVGYTLQEVRDAKDGACDVEIPIPEDGTLYSYVRIYKSVKMDDAKQLYNDANGKYIELDLLRIVFYSEPTTAPNLIEARYEKTVTTNPNENLEKLFTFSNKEHCRVTGKNYPDTLVIGSFDKPTVITDIFLRYDQAYINHTAIEASVDGETWVQIAKASNFWGNASNSAGTTIGHIHVFDENAYSYVRLIRNHNYGEWHNYSIAFMGEQVEPVIIPVDLAGYQRTAVQDGTYALRLIATSDDTAYTKAGMKLTCSAKNGDTWNFDLPAENFLTSITDRTNGTETTITAESLGGTKLYTAVLEGIPASLGLFSVTATPYVVMDGETFEYASQTIVMDGNSAMAESVFNLKENKDSLKISGRSHELENGIACDFTASGIEFNAVLAGDLKLTAKCSGETYYTLYLNGVRQPRIKLDTTAEKTYTIATNIPAGEYNVKLVKQTHIGHTTSDLIAITMCGSFKEAPKNKDLFIEFIGDSITCGYGVEGYPTAGVSYYGTAEFCDATQAYAYKTALQLGADYSMISVSGWSVLPDANNSSYVPGIYGQTSFKRSSQAYTPDRTADVVVVHLGTNDIAYRDNYETDFVTYAKAFLEDIAAMHPGAAIVWAYGSMSSGEKLAGLEKKVKTIIEEMGGSEWGFYCVKVPTNTAAGNGHPSAEGHSQTADILAEFIKENCLK